MVKTVEINDQNPWWSLEEESALEKHLCIKRRGYQLRV